MLNADEQQMALDQQIIELALALIEERRQRDRDQVQNLSDARLQQELDHVRPD